MRDLINVNVFLCEKYDEENNNIVNIFNKVKAGNEHRASFVIFTIIGEREKTEKTSGKFALHYYLTKKTEENGNTLCLYVASLNANFCDASDKDATTQVMGGIEMKKVPFLEEGKYEVEVYFSEDAIEENFEEVKAKSKEIMKESQFVASYPFEVVF